MKKFLIIISICIISTITSCSTLVTYRGSEKIEMTDNIIRYPPVTSI